MVASGLGWHEPESLPENARPTFWKRPCQETCLQTHGAIRFSGCSKFCPRPALLSPREPSPTPSGRPVTSTPTAQGADGGHGIQ